MIILGLGGSAHDYSACLVKDGEIIVAIEEERISRTKHGIRSAFELSRNRAADYCLEAAGLSAAEIDYVVGNDILNPAYYHRFRDRIELFNHHLCHAASALYCAPNRDNAAVLVIDGFGSPSHDDSGLSETITAYRVIENRPVEFYQVAGRLDRTGEYPVIENSLGGFYLAVTRAIGFDFMQEGKTMGLASFGRGTYVEQFRQFVHFDGTSGIRLTSRSLGELTDLCVREVAAAQTADRFQVKADLAYAAQAVLEHVVIELAQLVKSSTGATSLCLAGGVALNGVANWKILAAGIFESIFIQPACGDAGTALGAALYKSQLIGEPPSCQFSPYLGRRYGIEEMEAELELHADAVVWSRPPNPPKEVAQRLQRGCIVAVFSDRSEVGPRALGNRSILANPCIPEMGAILNERVKHREAFRPFAPIVMAEHQSEYFETAHESFHMLLVPPIRKEKRKEIPAVTHVDGTGRVQTVSENSNQHLHHILQEFRDLSGVPVLLNTSFNDNDEPIVETPADAVRGLIKLEIDYLLLGPFLVSRRS